jgi:hypothetical protein
MQVRATREATELLDLIDDLKSSLFHTDLTKFRGILQKNAALLGYLQVDDLGSTNREELIACLDKERQEILKMPRIKLTLAVNSEDSFLNKIYAWFSTNTEKTFLLDISVDASIVGGLLITYNGLYRDYSLKAKLDNYFNKFSTLYDLLQL